MASKETRKGRQTPTQSVILPYSKTLAGEAVKIYEETGLKAYPWEKNLLEPIMAVGDDGLWIHQKFGYSIARRNGKTEDIYMFEMWA